MEQHDQRMECLRMAFELGGKAEPVVLAAQQLLDFVAGRPAVAESRAEPAQSAAEQQEPAKPIDDAIAACGTALVMPEGGGLEDAVQSVEPEPAVTDGHSAENVLASATPEATAPEAAAPADDAGAPAGEAQASSDASATESSSTADTAGSTDPAATAVEPVEAPPAPAAAPEPVADGQLA
jgi:hypothetical protein